MIVKLDWEAIITPYHILFLCVSLFVKPLIPPDRWESPSDPQEVNGNLERLSCRAAGLLALCRWPRGLLFSPCRLLLTCQEPWRDQRPRPLEMCSFVEQWCGTCTPMGCIVAGVQQGGTGVRCWGGWGFLWWVGWSLQWEEGETDSQSCRAQQVHI